MNIFFQYSKNEAFPPSELALFFICSWSSLALLITNTLDTFYVGFGFPYDLHFPSQNYKKKKRKGVWYSQLHTNFIAYSSSVWKYFFVVHLKNIYIHTYKILFLSCIFGYPSPWGWDRSISDWREIWLRINLTAIVLSNLNFRCGCLEWIYSIN